MKCFVAILLLALVAIAMAVEKTPETETANQKVTDAVREKRGYYSPYAHGLYSPYAYNLPYTYSPYSYYRYPHHYPYYNTHYPNYYNY